MDLPTFRYHPNPLSTGSVVESDNECVCCGQARGFVYAGPVYAEDEYDECICPWCIADGSAADKLEASFTDDEGIGGDDWDDVSDEVIEAVSRRTPGFGGWQQERWWTHCDDAAAFIGHAGHDELVALGPQAIEAIQDDTGLPDGPQWQHFFAALSTSQPPTAYVFRCLHCGTYGGYQDAT
ncbi:CbrC family protein [Pseudomonadota bacterium AL_CKDN230030165-1A_HGKHYDSX7]